MGKVVGGDLRVFGVDGVRICDASVFPAPIAGHPMAAVYAIAKQAANSIDRLASNSKSFSNVERLIWTLVKETIAHEASSWLITLLLPKVKMPSILSFPS